MLLLGATFRTFRLREGENHYDDHVALGAVVDVAAAHLLRGTELLMRVSCALCF